MGKGCCGWVGVGVGGIRQGLVCGVLRVFWGEGFLREKGCW